MTTFLRGLWTLLSYLAIHKWLVFVGCARPGLLWQGLVHDWTKLLPDEFVPTLYGFNLKQVGWDGRLKRAIQLHYTRNPHHPEFWQVVSWPSRNPDVLDGARIVGALEMPRHFAQEMICDWEATSRQRARTACEWYQEHGHDKPLHPKTRAWVEKELGIHG